MKSLNIIYVQMYLILCVPFFTVSKKSNRWLEWASDNDQEKKNKIFQYQIKNIKIKKRIQTGEWWFNAAQRPNINVNKLLLQQLHTLNLLKLN